jgi:hypothetical protein
VVLALAAGAIVVVALLWEAGAPPVRRLAVRYRLGGPVRPGVVYDPGRERRAELRARELLRSCIDPADWEMYRDLGFLRVWGTSTDGDGPAEPGGSYAYLIYPHKPIVAFVPQTRELLSEYCVAFPDLDRPYGSARLPDSDDVLAKWMGLTGNERRLIARANMHLPGRQVDPQAVRRDLWRMARWEQSRLRRTEGAARVPAP